MKDQIEFPVRKRKRSGHVGAEDPYGIALSFGNERFARELFFGIIQHGTIRAERRENRHLLSAAARESQNLFAPQVAEPFCPAGRRTIRAEPVSWA